MPLRIALISREYPPALNSGGIGTYTYKTAGALAVLGQDVHVFTEGNDEFIQKNPGQPTVHGLSKINARPDERRAMLRAWAVARVLWREGPFDIVQACEWDAEAVVYALHRHSPLITRLATPTYLVNNLNRAPARRHLRSATLGRLERLQAKLSDHVISPGRSVADVVAADWQLDRRRVSLIPTGIEMPGEPKGRPGYGFDGRKYVLYFGRLEVRKGIHTWIDALGDVLASDPDVWALFAGQDLGMDGISFHEYAIRRLGTLVQRVTFLPRLPHEELFPLIAGAALVVMPSIWESIANACLEAMALGRPVVATTGSGFAELITDGLDGMLVQPDNRYQLAAAVLAGLSNPRRLEAIGRQARVRARDFELEKMASRLLSLYQQLATRPRIQSTGAVNSAGS